MEQFVLNCKDQILAKLVAFSKGPYWHVRLALICTLLAISVAFPSYYYFTKPAATLSGNWKAISAQIDSPLATQQHAPEMHESKIAFRLLMPVLGRLIPSESVKMRIGVLLFLQHIVGLLFYVFVAKWVEKLCGDKVIAVLVCFSFAFTFIGKSFFWDMEGFFDGVAFFLAFMAIYQYGIFTFVFLFLSFWVDERAIIASPLIYLYLRGTRGEMKLGELIKVDSVLCGYLGTVAGYIIIRTALSHYCGLHIPVSSGSAGGMHAWKQWPMLAMGIITPMSFFWFLLLIYSLFLLRNRKYAFVLLFGAALFVVNLAAFSVIDFTRSAAYELIAIFAALHALLESSSVEFGRSILLRICVVNAFIPGMYLMTQLYWMYPVIPHIIIFR
jgi:hypothetical protein